MPVSFPKVGVYSQGVLHSLLPREGRFRPSDVSTEGGLMVRK
jgi:hypothetical protein